MQPFGAPEGLIIFYLLFCAEIDQIKVHQSCLHRLYRSCWLLTFVMQEGPFLLIWRKQKFETISLIIFKYFLMVDSINNNIPASSLIQWVYKPWFDEIQQFVSYMMSTEQITYCQLSYQYSRILWSSLGIRNLSIKLIPKVWRKWINFHARISDSKCTDYFRCFWFNKTIWFS